MFSVSRVSIGSFWHLSGISIGFRLDLLYISHGPRWTSVGSPLGLHVLSVGHLVDFNWTFIGFLLILSWIITGSIGNYSGRKWTLKKWNVKMNPAASRASSECTINEMLMIQPGSQRVKNSGNHIMSPLKPITATPQNTAI